MLCRSREEKRKITGMFGQPPIGLRVTSLPRKYEAENILRAAGHYKARTLDVILRFCALPTCVPFAVTIFCRSEKVAWPFLSTLSFWRPANYLRDHIFISSYAYSMFACFRVLCPPSCPFCGVDCSRATMRMRVRSSARSPLQPGLSNHLQVCCCFYRM